MKTRPSFRDFLAIAGSSLISISFASAQATSNNWDTNADGNWTDALNWLGDAAYAEGIDNTATFGNVITANRIITLDADITIGNIAALDTSHNFTITGANTLTLDVTTGVPVLSVVNGRALRIESVIAGNDGLEITGGGSNGGVVLAGANTFTGGIHLNSGSTGVNQNFTTTAGLNGNLITVSGTSYAAFASNTNITGGVHINAGAEFRAGTNNSTLNITGALTGSGTLTHQQQGAGNQVITISDGSTFTGNIDYSMPRTARTVVSSLGDAGRIRFGVENFLNNQDRQHIFEFDSAATTDMVFNIRQFEILGSAPTTAPRPNAAFEITSNNSSHALIVNTDLINNHTGTEANLRFSGSSNQANTFAGDIGNGPGNGVDPSVLNLFKLGNGSWTLAGQNTYTGNTTVSAGTLTLADVSSMRFEIGGNGINNSILGTGTVNFNGELFFDLTNAGTTDGDFWNIVTVDTLNETFGSTFSVNSTLGAFTEDAGVWSLLDGNDIWTFSQSTGNLSLAIIPEPGTTLLGGLGLLALLRRRR